MKLSSTFSRYNALHSDVVTSLSRFIDERAKGGAAMTINARTGLSVMLPALPSAKLSPSALSALYSTTETSHIFESIFSNHIFACVEYAANLLRITTLTPTLPPCSYANPTPVYHAQQFVRCLSSQMPNAMPSIKLPGLDSLQKIRHIPNRLPVPLFDAHILHQFVHSHLERLTKSFGILV